MEGFPFFIIMASIWTSNEEVMILYGTTILVRKLLRILLLLMRFNNNTGNVEHIVNSFRLYEVFRLLEFFIRSVKEIIPIE